MNIASEHHLQIERIISRPKGPGWVEGIAHAEFQRPDGWFCCRACVGCREKEGYWIQQRDSLYSLEDASTVLVATRMAMDWIVEELARRAAVEKAMEDDDAIPRD